MSPWDDTSKSSFCPFPSKVEDGGFEEEGDFLPFRLNMDSILVLGFVLKEDLSLPVGRGLCCGGS